MTKAAKIALCIALSSGGALARAAEEPGASPLPAADRATEFSPGYTPGAPAPAFRPLMSLLNDVGVGQGLREAHIDVYGHVEASYTWNFNTPAQNLNLGRIFDAEHNKGLLNQLDLNLERRVDLAAGQLDVGGRIEMLYGSDARFITSSDFFDHQGPVSNSGLARADAWFDIPQLYVDVAIPVGNGLRVRAGKFLFFKQIDPNASVFYSHSFIFGGALPFTNTGVTAFYPFGNGLSVEGGFSRGWDQTLTDNNGAIDALGRVRYTMDKQTDISLAAIFGPELNRDNSHYRTTLDLAVTHQCNAQCTILLDAVYGYQAMPAGVTSAQWYGLAGYGVYQLSDYVSLGLRGEWYRDEEALTTGLAQSLFEGTLGATITPFPTNEIGRNLKIRPEIRYDYATRRYFDGASKHNQTTIGIDAIFNF